jgi:hypothetical protein
MDPEYCGTGAKRRWGINLQAAVRLIMGISWLAWAAFGIVASNREMSLRNGDPSPVVDSFHARQHRLFRGAISTRVVMIASENGQPVLIVKWPRPRPHWIVDHGLLIFRAVVLAPVERSV